MLSVAAAVDAAVGSGVVRASRAERAAWLEALAATLEAHRDELVALAASETQLSEARLTGEVTRTAFQLRFFAGVILEGSYLEATIDEPDLSLIPPRPELRRMLRPLGPVAVYAASNFPFAFSVLGNDTASALAAGCPVVVKAHPGHPQLSRRVAELATAALAEAGAPAGTFALVEGMDAGIALVQHPGIRAAGFTGSEAGGRALFDLACARPAPIPFYGELGSLNPVVLTTAAVAARGGEIAAGLVGSFTRDGGQYCTKPGLVFAPASSNFVAQVAEAYPAAVAQRLLTAGMTANFARIAGELAAHPAVELVGAPGDGEASEPSQPVVVAVAAEAVLADPELFLRECFGPLTLIVRYRDEAQLHQVLGCIEGSLTGTVHCEPGEDVTGLTAVLVEIAGRVLFNGWPTGVAIAWGQQHGGPWPATTAAIHSSVGATAIRRWLTPISYQEAPASVLPAELLDANPHGIPRRVNGALIV